MAARSPIDLTAPLDVGGVVGTATRIWRSRPSVFLAIAVLVVVPIELLVFGVAEGGFNDPYGQVTEAAAMLDGLVTGTVYSALISATHARAVVMLADDGATTASQVVRAAFATLGAVFLAGLLYTLFVMLGTAALIVPGIYLATAGVFMTQIKALTATPAGASYKSSSYLVGKVGFGETFLLLLLGWIAPRLVVEVLYLGIVPAADAIDNAAVSGPLAVTVVALATAITVSWTALVTTTAYFAWRVRAGDPWSATSDEQPRFGRDADWTPAG